MKVKEVGRKEKKECEGRRVSERRMKRNGETRVCESGGHQHQVATERKDIATLPPFLPLFFILPLVLHHSPPLLLHSFLVRQYPSLPLLLIFTYLVFFLQLYLFLSFIISLLFQTAIFLLTGVSFHFQVLLVYPVFLPDIPCLPLSSFAATPRLSFSLQLFSSFSHPFTFPPSSYTFSTYSFSFLPVLLFFILFFHCNHCSCLIHISKGYVDNSARTCTMIQFVCTAQTDG